MTAEDRLHRALAMALERYAEMMNEPFATPADLVAVPDADFWAVVRMRGEGCEIRATEGVVEAVDDLWRAVLDAPDATLKPGHPEEMAALSLAWLMHHEMEHVGLEHLDVMPALGLTETDHPNARAILEHAPIKTGSPVDLGFEPDTKPSIVDRCLELQADHDAIGMITGPYHSEGWDDLRRRVACIFAVMILIDREDRKHGHIGESHPRAATRIFQLLGHMAIFWSVPAQKIAWEAGRKEIDPADLPPAEEIEAFKEQVVRPAFEDAAAIARAAGSDDIAAELGDPTDFFADIALAHAKAATEPEGFKTTGAKEWAELYPINEAAMRKLGHREQRPSRYD